jgi:DNA-binding transcriptional MerR regulator
MIHTRASAASILGVHPSTLKRWETEGIIPPASRDSTGRRVYDAEEIERLKAIAEERREVYGTLTFSNKR